MTDLYSLAHQARECMTGTEFPLRPPAKPPMAELAIHIQHLQQCLAAFSNACALGEAPEIAITLAEMNCAILDAALSAGLANYEAVLKAILEAKASGQKATLEGLL